MFINVFVVCECFCLESCGTSWQGVLSLPCRAVLYVYKLVYKRGGVPYSVSLGAGSYVGQP